MPLLHITTESGIAKDITAKTGDVLMEALRDDGLIQATCGGAASCGTCHIYFADKSLVGEQTEDEGYMLEGLADFVDVNEFSRLACQVTVTDAHDKASVTIASEA